MKRAIAVFAKAPVPGETKSRLAADIGDVKAAELSEALLRDVSSICVEHDADCFLFYPPQNQPEQFFDIVDESMKFRVQEGDDLGQRMYNCFAALLKDYEQLIIVGSDCISCSQQAIDEAFLLLNDHDLVIQPADDGGYVLIAMSTAQKSLFENIDWGTDTVLTDSLKQADAAGLSTACLVGSFDIDLLEDLPKLAAFCQNNDRPHCSRWLHQNFKK